MRSRLIPAGVLILILSGCAPLSGPLVMTGAPGSICVDVAPGDEILIGQFVVGPDLGDAELTSAGLDHPDGLEVTRAWMVPVKDEVIGSSPYPPSPSPAWNEREEIPGAVVPAGEERRVLFLVRRTGDAPASADAFTLDYTVDGVSYRNAGDFGVQLRDDCLD